MQPMEGYKYAVRYNATRGHMDMDVIRTSMGDVRVGTRQHLLYDRHFEFWAAVCRFQSVGLKSCFCKVSLYPGIPGPQETRRAVRVPFNSPSQAGSCSTSLALDAVHTLNIQERPGPQQPPSATAFQKNSRSLRPPS